MKAQRISLVTAVIALTLGVTACTGAPAKQEAESPTRIQMSSAQASALQDKEVTREEYEAGFRRYAACDARAGYKILARGEANQVLNFAVPDAAVQAGADGKCYDSEFKQVDAIWQTSRQNTSQTAADFRACVTKAGHTPATTYPALVEQLDQLGLSPDTCSP